MLSLGVMPSDLERYLDTPPRRCHARDVEAMTLHDLKIGALLKPHGHMETWEAVRVEFVAYDWVVVRDHGGHPHLLEAHDGPFELWTEESD